MGKITNTTTCIATTILSFLLLLFPFPTLIPNLPSFLPSFHPLLSLSLFIFFLYPSIYLSISIFSIGPILHPQLYTSLYLVFLSQKGNDFAFQRPFFINCDSSTGFVCLATSCGVYVFSPFDIREQAPKVLIVMDELGSPRFECIGNAVRRKRTQTSRRPKPESQAVPETLNQSPSSLTPPSEDAAKVSSDENGIDANPKRKLFDLNQCALGSSSATTGTEGEYPHKRIMKEDRGSSALHNSGGLEHSSERRQNGLTQKQSGNHGTIGGEGGNGAKVKKLKLKVGGATTTRTIQAKSSSLGASVSGSSSKSTQSSDAQRPRPKLILQDNSAENNSPFSSKRTGLQGIPWKDFSRGGFSLGRQGPSIEKMPKSSSGKQGEKERARKSKRVAKKRVLDGEFDDEDDDEIRYLEKLKTSKGSAFRDFEEEPNYEEEEEVLSEHEMETKSKRSWKDSPDSPTESKRETTLTSRQRALRGDVSSATDGSQIEFPNGLPPAPPRKQKEKLTEVEQQLKKTEAAERRRIQNEKAARESEAEAIRKILGQDSSRKKREDKLKKRQEELAQERAANAKTLAPGTVRTVMGPTGTVVTFAEGLPPIFDPKPSGYPPPRERCAGPSCNNPYRYRDSKTNQPLCSLQCYKAIREKMVAETA